MPGDAQTLRDYWSGHGHAGPSHGAERDAIAWGTTGDFDRCVALVTEHGKMTPDQAKGYCNLRHHDALGEWPAQHAAREKGKAVSPVLTPVDADPVGAFLRVQAALKAAGSQESRVPVGSATGGQFTTGSDGPAKKQPNPFAGGKQPGWAAGPGGKPRGGKPGKPGKKTGPGRKPPKAPSGKTNSTKQHAEHVAHLRHEVTQLNGELTSLEAQKKKLSTTGVRSFGTKPTVKPAAKPATSTSSSTTTTRTGSSVTGSSASSRPGSSPSSASSSRAAQLAAVNARIASVRAQLASVRQQLQAATSTGKATDPDLTKAEPHRYRHGWIKIGEDIRGKDLSKGDTFQYAGKESTHRVVSDPKSDGLGGHTFDAVRVRDDGSEGPKLEHHPSATSSLNRVAPADPKLVADRLASSRDPRSMSRDLTSDQLAAADSELSQRAATLGKPGQVARHHRAVKDEIARRGATKSVRNPRDTPSGRFRTFQGELNEARQALAEGRVSDVIELLGSARALAQTDQERLVLGQLQQSVARVQHVQPDIVKESTLW